MSVSGDISYEEGWPILQEAINKLIDPSSGQIHTPQFSTDEYMKIYSTAYDMCVHKPHGPVSRKMFDQFNIIIEDHINFKVLPSLRDMKDVVLLEEIVRRWNDNKIIAKWLSRFLHYLDRFFLPHNKFPTLYRICHLTFYKLVYGEMKDQVKEAVISLVNREREGEVIDQALVKNVLAIYDNMSEDSIKYYKEEFEEALVKNTAAFYSSKASNWIASESYSDYVLKVDECLKRERDRCSVYFQDRIQDRLLEVVQRELLTVHAIKLEDKKAIDANAAYIES